MICFLIQFLLLSSANPGNTLLSEAVTVESRSIQPKDSDPQNLLSVPPASPDCWLAAFKSLEDVHFTPNGAVDATACSWMAPDHQKALALELARCHLKDMGRSISTLPQDKTDCSNTNVADCLNNLTDIGVNTYTQFFAYVNQLCVRLLQEVVVDHYYSTSYKLAQSSELAEGRLKEMIHQQDIMWSGWMEREEQLATFHEDVREEMVENVLAVQNKLKESEATWIREQEQVRKDQDYAFEQQLQALQTWSIEVRKNITEDAMTPWWYHSLQSVTVTGYTRLHSMFDYAVAAYSWFQRVAFFLSIALPVVLLTLPRCLRWMRFHMILFLLLEVGLEIFVEGADDGWMPVSLEELQVCLQTTLISFETLFYLLGVISSLCGRRGRHTNDGTPVPHGAALNNGTPLSNPAESQAAFFQRLEASRTAWNEMARQNGAPPQATTASNQQLPQNVPLSHSGLNPYSQAGFPSFEFSNMGPPGVPTISPQQNGAAAAVSPLLPQYSVPHAQNPFAQQWIAPSTSFQAPQQPAVSTTVGGDRVTPAGPGGEVAPAAANMSLVPAAASGNDKGNGSSVAAGGCGDDDASHPSSVDMKKSGDAMLDDSATENRDDANVSMEMDKEERRKRSFDDVSGNDDDDHDGLDSKRRRVSSGEASADESVLQTSERDVAAEAAELTKEEALEDMDVGGDEDFTRV